MKIIEAALLTIILTATTVSASNHVRRGAVSSESGNARIINGVNAPIARYPYTVSLQDGAFHFCGGSLIAPDVVLSAAHCAPGLTGGQDIPRIVLNPHNLNNPLNESQVLGVQEYIQHPFYETLGSYDHDYMLIKLNGTSSLPLVRLNTNESLPQVGSTLQVMGWGTTIAGFTNLPDILQEVDVVTISNEECQSATPEYEDNISPDSLCAAEVNKGSCQGDSGGPLIIPGGDNTQDVQVGVVSWGIGCAEAEHPGVYARIEEEYDWLRFQVCQLSSNPPEYFQCDGEVTFSPAPTSAPTAPTVSPSPTRDSTDVLVQINLDSYPFETGWRIEDDTGMVVTEVLPGFYNDSYSTFSEIVSLPTNAECKFILSDSYGDGLDGWVVVYLGTEVDDTNILGYYTHTDDGSNYFSRTYEFTITVSEQGIIPSDVFQTQAPSSPMITPSQTPTAPTISPSPTSSDVEVLFVIEADMYPGEIGWFISQLEGIVFQVAPGTYSTPLTEYYVTVLLQENQEYQLTLTDTFGDGLLGNFTVYLGPDPTPDNILAYYSNNLMSFSTNYTIDFLVSQDGIITGTFPTTAPTTAPLTPPSGKYPPCNVCGDSMSVAKHDAIWDYTSGISLRCGEVEMNGIEGLISQDYCQFLPSLLGDTCGCEGIKNGQSNTPPPTNAPSAAYQGPHPSCSVCGEGMRVSQLNSVPSSSQYTCEELEDHGARGTIAEYLCVLYPDVISSACGCIPTVI